MFFLKELPTQQMVEGYQQRYPATDLSAVGDALAMLRQASVMIRGLERYFKTHNTSQLRFLILIVIDREPESDGLTISEITDRLDVSHPVMTRTLQAMVSDELISIADHPDDRRAKLVRLSAHGKASLDALLPGYFALINEYMAASATPYG
ncbi:MAG: MarR family transcriptional regulator [Pseudomonadota bacterium]